MLIAVLLVMIMSEWKKNLFKEFHLCTHLDIYFFDRYDSLLYKYSENENESTEEIESSLGVFAYLSQQKENYKNFATVSFGKQTEYFYTACYFDDSLPELGRVIFGPYTEDVEMAEKISFLPRFAVQHAVDLLHRFRKEYSLKNEMYDSFDKSVSHHFMKIAKYIEDNVNMNITLDMVAKNVNLSKPYVCDIVKRATNHTVSQFIAKVKINKAKVLFLNNFTDIHEVSLIIGYKSQGYFSRQFKAFEGVPPTNYVQKLNKDVKC